MQVMDPLHRSFCLLVLSPSLVCLVGTFPGLQKQILMIQNMYYTEGEFVLQVAPGYHNACIMSRLQNHCLWQLAAATMQFLQSLMLSGSHDHLQ